MKIDAVIEGLTSVKPYIDAVELAHGVDLGEFLVSFISLNHRQLHRAMQEQPQIGRLLEDAGDESGSGQSFRNPKPLRSLLAALACQLDLPDSYHWLEQQVGSLPLSVMGRWSLDYHPLCNAIDYESLQVLEMLHLRHGNALFKAELFNGQGLFSHAIGHNKKRAALWMVEKDPDLLADSIRLSNGPDKSQARYMSVLEYAGTSCPSNSTLPQALRSLTVAREARRALSEIAKPSAAIKKGALP